MSNKQKRKALKLKREESRAKVEDERLRHLTEQGRFANGVVLPLGAIPADLSVQAPNNSYDPPLFYEDTEFQCVDCGVTEIWMAEQQQWYFEVAKGSIYGRAIRCRACRKKQRAVKERQQRGVEEG